MGVILDGLPAIVYTLARLYYDGVVQDTSVWRGTCRFLAFDLRAGVVAPPDQSQTRGNDLSGSGKELMRLE